MDKPETMRKRILRAFLQVLFVLLMMIAAHYVETILVALRYDLAGKILDIGHVVYCTLATP